MSVAEPLERVVIKVGSAVVAPGGRLDVVAITRLVDDLAGLRHQGSQVVLVSSGAVACGFRALGADALPTSIRPKQAAAAVGQPALMRAYSERLAMHAITPAQVLLTADDFAHRERFLNARHTLETLLISGALPIVNENDSVVFDEMKLGDNDRLSALVATSCDADMLILLSVAPGLLDRDSGTVIPHVRSIAEARRHVDSAASSGVGTGGMATKLDAAQIAVTHGIPAHLTQGPTDARPNPIAQVIAGVDQGTRFEPDTSLNVRARKSWIGFAAAARGVLIVDDGAAKAISRKGASLLPGGIARVEGSFEAGAAVDIVDRGGTRIARGLVSYAAEEIERIKGRHSESITEILGYTYADEVVHRNDMQVMKDANAQVD
ncbi:MAG: glutamate 5-kinase [Phycisphaerales bacterium]|nr:glutamate 5-kinase [Phycisphaerales bacterium]